MEKIRIKIQLAFTAFFNIGLFQWHFICFPVLNCHSCPISIFACPLGTIGQFASLGIVPLSVIGLMALAGLTIGRFFCGWACPFGFLQELIYKVPYVKFNIPSWLRYLKYAVFAALVVAVPIYLTPESTFYFCRLCPAGTIQSAIPWAIINGTTNIGHLALRLGILFAIIILAMGHRRFFCKVICPLGAFLSLFNRFALIFPERRDSCTSCGACNKPCPMETKPKSDKYGVFVKKPEECITCLECREKCPTHSVQLWG